MVTVEGYTVDYNQDARNIAMKITFDDDDIVVELRDPETGVPLWRQPGQK